MNKIGLDLIGELFLYKDSGKQNPIIKDYWGQANVTGEKRSDSYYIYLSEVDQLALGDKAIVAFKFKFSDDERFKIKIKEGQTLELKEGDRKIGELIILKILNEKLK